MTLWFPQINFLRPFNLVRFVNFVGALRYLKKGLRKLHKKGNVSNSHSPRNICKLRFIMPSHLNFIHQILLCRFPFTLCVWHGIKLNWNYWLLRIYLIRILRKAPALKSLDSSWLIHDSTQPEFLILNLF